MILVHIILGFPPYCHACDRYDYEKVIDHSLCGRQKIFKSGKNELNVTFCHIFAYAGAWIKSSWGHVQREGDQLSLTYIAPQLGYWLAAMSPLHSGEKLP